MVVIPWKTVYSIALLFIYTQEVIQKVMFTKRKKRNNPNSQELGLRIAHIFGRYLLHTDHLHYGYWPEDLPVCLENLPRAQDLYSQFLCDHIPADCKTILDVGSGTGHNAELLLARGFEVDCVSPSPYLSDQIAAKIEGRGTLYRCIFEDLPPGKRYDCVIFSESFQYIDLDTIFATLDGFLNPGGHVVISDFFRIPGEGTSAMGGGHRLNRFREKLEKSRFRVNFEADITERTAPNLTLVNNALDQLAIPLRDMVIDELDTHHRLLFRPARWFAKLFFRKKLDKLEYKYFSGSRNAENFKQHKRYMFFQLALQV